MYIIEENQDMLQACSAKQCFAFSKDPKDLQNQIVKYITDHTH